MSTTTPPTDTSSRPRLRADAERNRRRILAAAAEVFARRGLEAGLDEIARHAGVGTGTVYRRFPDKRLLIDALFESRIENLIELAEDAAQNEDAWEGLRSFMHAALEMQVADRGLNELLFTTVHETVLHAKRQLTPLIAEMVERAQASGRLRPDVTLSDLAMIQMMMQGVGAVAHEVSPELWRRHLVLALDALCTDRPGPTPLPVPPISVEEFETACHRGRCPEVMRPPGRDAGGA